jgi:hypothetical protein
VVAAGADLPAKLYRYSYSGASHSYALDAGFPVTVRDGGAETIVIDKDTAGRFWGHLHPKQPGLCQPQRANPGTTDFYTHNIQALADPPNPTNTATPTRTATPAVTTTPAFKQDNLPLLLK